MMDDGGVNEDGGIIGGKRTSEVDGGLWFDNRWLWLWLVQQGGVGNRTGQIMALL